MLWIWANEPTSDDEAMIYGVPAAIDALDLSFDDGDRLTVEVPLVEITRDEDSQGVLTDNLIAPGVRGLLLSSRLRDILKDNGVDNVQYYPCIVTNPEDGHTTEDYHIGNIVGSVACLDWDKSEVQRHRRFPDRIQFIDRLVLKEGDAKGLRIFRLAEYTQIIVVDDSLKRACADAQVTGVRFYAPEEYSL